jgi:ribose/xylose/arabinose/galactoside ABC-type transport system permease subunit
MTLKNAALFARVGMVLLSVVLVVSFVNILLGVINGVVPAITLLTSFIHALAGVSVAVFFYVFHRAQ